MKDKYNIGSDLYCAIFDKVESFFINKFPDFNFNKVLTEEEFKRRRPSFTSYRKNLEGKYIMTDSTLLEITIFLLNYERIKEGKIKEEISDNGVSTSKEICENILKKARGLKKEMDSIPHYLSNLLCYYNFSDLSSSKLINKKSGYLVKSPLKEELDGYYSFCFRETLNSYSEIEKTPESIMILSAFVLEDLILCIEKIKKKLVPKRGNSGKESKILMNIILGIAYIFFKCTGEKPNIKRSGSSLSKKHRFNQIVLEFENKFKVQFNYIYAQKQIENTIFENEKELSDEEILEEIESMVDEHVSDSEL